MALIDIGSGCRHSLGYKLRGLSHLVFRDIKMSLIEAGKERTQGSGGNTLTITLDNFAASRSIEADERDIRASRCIFVQAFRALHHKDTKVLRSCWDGDRVFQVGLFMHDDGCWMPHTYIHQSVTHTCIPYIHNR